MLGAIIGDIVGSTREWRNIKTEDFELVPTGSRFTDDTVMTLADRPGAQGGDVGGVYATLGAQISPCRLWRHVPQMAGEQPSSAIRQFRQRFGHEGKSGRSVCHIP